MKNLYLTAFLALLLSSCSKETGFDVSESGEVVKFTRFTHYMYRMKTTSNKLITNIL